MVKRYKQQTYKWDVFCWGFLELFCQGLIKCCHIFNINFKEKLPQIILPFQCIPESKKQQLPKKTALKIDITIA